MQAFIDKTRQDEFDTGIHNVFSRVDKIKRLKQALIAKLLSRPEDEPYSDQAHLWTELKKMEIEIAHNEIEVYIDMGRGKYIEFVRAHWDEIQALYDRGIKAPNMYPIMVAKYDMDQIPYKSFYHAVNTLRTRRKKELLSISGR